MPFVRRSADAGLVRFRRFLHQEKGQALIEYSLIMALIVVVVLIMLIVMGNTVRNLYCNIAAAVGQ
jgi:Flp pilus assembly pilin Flp